MIFKLSTFVASLGLVDIFKFILSPIFTFEFSTFNIISSTGISVTVISTCAVLFPTVAVIVAAAAAILSGGYGVKKGFDASENMSKARNIQKSNEEIVKSSEWALNEARRSSCNSIKNLGKIKMDIYKISLKKFLRIYSKIQNVSFVDNIELENFKPGKKDFNEFKQVSYETIDYIEKAGISGIAGGSLLAMGAYGGVMSAAGGLAVASTGTAIGSLSGAAATNATLAWLGGGSLASGGLGMAGGMAVLGGLVVGPALAIGGVVLSHQAEKELYAAKNNKDKALKYQAEVATIILKLNSIVKYAEQINDLLKRLDEYFSKQIREMVAVIDFWGCDYSKLDSKRKKVIYKTALFAKTIKSVLEINLLTEDGNLNNELKLDEILKKNEEMIISLTK